MGRERIRHYLSSIVESSTTLADIKEKLESDANEEEDCYNEPHE